MITPNIPMFLALMANYLDGQFCYQQDLAKMSVLLGHLCRDIFPTHLKILVDYLCTYVERGLR